MEPVHHAIIDGLFDIVQVGDVDASFSDERNVTISTCDMLVAPFYGSSLRGGTTALIAHALNGARKRCNHRGHTGVGRTIWIRAWCSPPGCCRQCALAIPSPAQVGPHSVWRIRIPKQPRTECPRRGYANELASHV